MQTPVDLDFVYDEIDEGDYEKARAHDLSLVRCKLFTSGKFFVSAILEVLQNVIGAEVVKIPEGELLSGREMAAITIGGEVMCILPRTTSGAGNAGCAKLLIAFSSPGGYRNLEWLQGGVFYPHGAARAFAFSSLSEANLVGLVLTTYCTIAKSLLISGVPAREHSSAIANARNCLGRWLSDEPKQNVLRRTKAKTELQSWTIMGDVAKRYGSDTSWSQRGFHCFRSEPGFVQQVIAMETLEAEIANGGWGQLLWNTLPNWQELLRLAKLGYMAIGANRQARAIDRLAEKFESEARRCSALKALGASNFGKFSGNGYLDKSGLQEVFLVESLGRKRERWLKRLSTHTSDPATR